MKILEEILIDKKHRLELIKKFQELVWNDENVDEVLANLAYDLDFYEPNFKLQKEDISYYGDERLEEEIKATLKKLKYNKKC